MSVDRLQLHYETAGAIKHQARLIGSATARAGIEMFGGAPPERPEHRKKPKRDGSLPYWVITDSQGLNMGLLHASRGFEFCRDVIVLIADSTPRAFVKYLEEREYDHHRLGKRRVNHRKALELLAEKYRVRTVLTDTGPTHCGLLLAQGLADEISLVVHPVLVGKGGLCLAPKLMRSGVVLKLKNSTTKPGGCLHVLYRIVA